VKIAAGTVLAGLLAIVQVSVMPYIEVLGVTPNLVLIFAATWTVVRGHDEAIYVIPASGFLLDLTTGDPVGTSVLALLPLIPVAALVRLRVLDSDFLPTIAVVAVGSLIYGIISMTVLAVTGQTVAWSDAVVRIVLPSCLVNAVFTPIIFIPIHLLSTTERDRTVGARRLTSPL
jgi:rod shape-determining protein MreD